METKSKNKGLVFYVTSKGMVYYINNNREHIWIENISLLATDPIYKDIVRRTAKAYTMRGYNRISKNFFLYNDAVKTCWLSFGNYDKRHYFHNDLNII